MVFYKKKNYYKPFYETESINNFVVSSLKFVKRSPDRVNNRRPIKNMLNLWNLRYELFQCHLISNLAIHS